MVTNWCLSWGGAQRLLNHVPAPGRTADWQARKEAGWQLLKGRSLTARLPELHLRTQAPRTRRTLVFGKGSCVCSTPPIFCSEKIESKGHISQVNVCYDRLKWPQILCSFSHQEVGILSYSLNQGSHSDWLWPTEYGGGDAVRLPSLGLCRLCSFLSLSLMSAIVWRSLRWKTIRGVPGPSSPPSWVPRHAREPPGTAQPPTTCQLTIEEWPSWLTQSHGKQ